MKQFLIERSVQPKEFIDRLAFEFDNATFDVLIQQNLKDQNVAKIITDSRTLSESQTSLIVVAELTEKGLLVTVSDQEWGGIAASLGTTVVAAILNPINLVGRIDDLAADVQNLQLGDKVEQFIRNFSDNMVNKSSALAPKSVCKYCRSRNEDTATHCASCGAPL